jgi:hypothetical protein
VLSLTNEGRLNFEKSDQRTLIDPVSDAVDVGDSALDWV